MSSEGPYDLSATLGTDTVSPLDAGGSLLLAGPDEDATESLLLGLLAEGHDRGEGVLAVTTERDAETWLSTLQDRTDRFDGRTVAALDCHGEGERTEETLESGVRVQRVPRVDDLTGIGIGITSCLQALTNSGCTSGRAGFSSLTTLVEKTNRETVFKFSHVVTARLDTANFLGVFTVDSGAHDEETLQVIGQSFDAIIDVREDGRAVRSRNLGVEEAWVELPDA